MTYIPQEKRDEFEQRVLDDIARVGWSDIGVFPTKDMPGVPFNYTVGLHNYDHPEILIMGLPNEQLHGVLGAAYNAIKSGTRFTPDMYYNFVLNGHRVACVENLDYLGDYPMTMANALNGDGMRAVQLVWPDQNDRFPWHSDFDKRLLDRQVLQGPWRGED